MAAIGPSMAMGMNPAAEDAPGGDASTRASASSPAAAAPIPTFREAFDAHAAFVWRSLLGLGVRDADVADASQQVFVVLHGKLDRLAPGCALRTFVYGICLRVASDFRQRAHVRHEQLHAQPVEQSTRLTPEDELSHRETLRRLDDALGRLDPAQRDVFVLYEIEDLPMIEVARAVGCPLQTAYSRLHAARRVVAAALDPSEQP
jgi:RNA polymerase sigma-70 factor (ECF subfamily)